MHATQFFLILYARRKVFFRTLLFIVAVALIASLVMPKSYTATTTLVVDNKGVDPVSGVTLPAQLLPGYIATQVDIINSKSVALQVVDALHLAGNTHFKERFQDATGGKGDIRYWIAEALQKKLKVNPSRESSVVDIAFKDGDPRFAADAANAFAMAYRNTTAELRADPLKNASDYFNKQIKALRDNMESTQKKLSKYQEEKGIVNADSSIDVETMRLNDLSAQLVAAQGQLMEAESRRNQALGKGGSESPDIIANPLIQSLKTALAQAQAKLADVAAAYTPEHPQYQRAKAEVDKLRSELNANLRATSNSIANNANILRAREQNIRDALEAQRAKVFALNRARDDLSVLTKEAENAQKAYEAATQRFNQTSLEGQAHQPEVAVLNPAAVPLRPSSPKLWLNLAVSLFLGTLLGVGLAMLIEMLDRRVRTVSDLQEILQVPVLGILPPMAAAIPRRRFGFKRLVAQRMLPNLT